MGWVVLDCVFVFCVTIWDYGLNVLYIYSV